MMAVTSIDKMHTIYIFNIFIMNMKVSQSCPTLCHSMDYTDLGILQARILEWVTFPFSRGSSQPKDQTQASHIAGRFFTVWATSEAPSVSTFSFFPGNILPGSGRSTGERIGYPLQYSWASLVAQLVKNLPAMWETWVQSVDWEDLLEKGMATHSSILAWRIPWTEESGGLQSMGLQRVGHDWATSPTPVFMDFPCGSAGKESACNVGGLGLIPGLGRSPGGVHGNPVQ